jgi:capsular polysaccharide export protein
MSSQTPKFGGSVIHALDFSPWKRPVVRRCFPERKVVFINDSSAVPAESTLAVWGMKPIDGPLAPGVDILRLEDGFLRSVGLGADLIQPMSWVVDGCGMYYDATRPSDLEHLLTETKFTSEMVARAAGLRQRIVAEGLTKYNVGIAGWQRPAGAKKVILVPGQVESDASLAYGAPDIRSNIGLLQAVRLENPKAYILYKPHPDVMAGLRARGAREEEALRWYDEQVVDVSMGVLLTAVDEVHVLTSLAGFEALLRGRAVTCYGQPFYSGWGLTRDIVPHTRRRRSLTIDELVAGALIAYPLYLSRTNDALITPERALDELVAWRAKAGSSLPWWRRCFRVFLRLVIGVR